MKMRPKTITIFLVHGEPDGLRVAELGNWVGQAIVIPRNKLKDTKERQDCNKPAVYFLIGKENEEDLPAAYIGEAENLHDRLSLHDGPSNVRDDNFKDIWHIAIAFVSKDTNLTKAHVKYLESKCLKIARQTKRFRLVNKKDSSEPSLPESAIAEMEEFLDNLKLLLAAVGYPLLQKITPKEEKNIPLFICGSSKAKAKASGRITNDGFVVYEGSTVTTKPANAIKEKFQRKVAYLKASSYLKEKDENHYVFVKDYVFSSPSEASGIVLGHPSNGWNDWKTEKGKTLDEIYRPVKS